MTLFPPDLREERAESAVPGLRYLPGFLSPAEQEDAILERGSALALTGEARRDWRHCIAKRRRERGGRERKRRLSLTFRTVRAGATDTGFPRRRG